MVPSLELEGLGVGCLVRSPSRCRFSVAEAAGTTIARSLEPGAKTPKNLTRFTEVAG